MTKEEFKFIYESGDDVKLRETIVEMNKEHTFRELSLFACVTYNEFRGITKRLNIKSNLKRVKTARRFKMEGSRY
ncbi:MAG: hypothetical protein COA79_26430 [Planctomycetota bacterium]|nr:MAG: hypothetical protein COA79_26430 [Planctomycetota bacterium]